MYLSTSAFETPAAGFLIFDAHGRSIWANGAAARFFGVRREELVDLDRGALLRLLATAVDNPFVFVEGFQKSSPRGDIERELYVRPAQGRKERWLSVRTLSIQTGPFAGGHIQQYLDLTEGRRLRLQLECGAQGCWSGKDVEQVHEVVTKYAVGDDRLCSSPLFSIPVEASVPSTDFPTDEGGAAPFTDQTDLCRLLLDQLDLGVMVVNGDHTIEMANAAAGRLLDLPHGSIVGRKCYHVLTRHDDICPSCPGVRTRESGLHVLEEVERHAGGEGPALLFKVLPLTAGRFALLMENVSERRLRAGRAEESFAHEEPSRDWIGSILHSVADGLVVTDRDGRVLLMNSAAEKLLGVRQPQLFQAALEDCIHDRRLLRRFREAVEGGENGTRFEWEISSSAGVRILTVGISQVHGGGTRGGTVFLLQDVTPQREVDRMKNEFISTAAHELRTPLTSILGFSELLLTRTDLSVEQQSDFLTFIHQKAENLSRIISDLLDVSRIEAGRGLELNRERCHIEQLLHETVEPYRKCSAKHSLEVVLPSCETFLNIDRGKIIQVIENLLSNAFKYSPRGGVVRVTASLARGAYLVSVEDQGIGMNREQLARAFDKFYRGDSSNAAVEGTGLGLAITKYIVEAHGGRIWLESRRAKGTTASFSLPLLPDQGL